MSEEDLLLETEEEDDGFQYSVMSETTEPDDFIKVCEDEDDDDKVTEVVKESDGSVLLSTLQDSFPNAVGLRYKSESGSWRGVRMLDGVLEPPHGGWGSECYIVTAKKGGDQEKMDDSITEKRGHNDLEYLQDLFVTLHEDITVGDLKDYFTEVCGLMLRTEIKYSRATGTSRGFGFIRFKTIEAAKEAVHGHHAIKGHKVEVQLPKSKEFPCQLFVGRLPEDTTKDDLISYFSSYGIVTEAHVTIPFRGFGFVTFASTNVARSILKKNHDMKGSRLNLKIAEPLRSDKTRRPPHPRFMGDNHRRRERDMSNGFRRERPSRHEQRHDPIPYNPRYRPSRGPPGPRYESPPRRHSARDTYEVMNELKNMLSDVIAQQGRRRR